jgi:cobalamin-dependent methionine synthase I
MIPQSGTLKKVSNGTQGKSVVNSISAKEAMREFAERAKLCMRWLGHYRHGI